MKKIIALLTFFILLVTLTPVFADAISPLPNMYFHIIYENSNHSITLLGGNQMECTDENCTTMKSLASGNGFHCYKADDNGNTVDVCASQTDVYSPYQKLILNFSDKTRESNIFAISNSNVSTPYFFAGFNVSVTDSQLIVKEIYNSTSAPTGSTGKPYINNSSIIQQMLPVFIPSLIITVVIELLVGYAFIRKTKKYKRILVSIAIANLISLPIVWFLFYTNISTFNPPVLIIIFSEVFAMIFEALFIYLINRKLISFKRTLIMSIVMNLASFSVGFILLIMLSPLL